MCLERCGPIIKKHLQWWLGGARASQAIDHRYVCRCTSTHVGRKRTVLHCLQRWSFNYRELRRQELEAKGVTFFSQSDTEVVLKLFILEKEKCLNKLNGFFALCVYDKQEQTFCGARPVWRKAVALSLWWRQVLFASEMKSIMQYGIDKTIDFNSLYSYLQLNYILHLIPFSKCKKLLPGHYPTIANKKLTTGKYDIPVEEDGDMRMTKQRRN